MKSEKRILVHGMLKFIIIIHRLCILWPLFNSKCHSFVLRQFALIFLLMCLHVNSHR